MGGFQKATKAKARLRMALLGPSGAGKTYSALNIAKHIGGRVALVDTEHGSASKYADVFDFDTLELESFNPDRYIEAIETAEEGGYDILIIDSLSHAWAGKDGVLEFVDRTAERSQSGNRYIAWGKGTPLHNRLVEKLLGCNLHLIVTMRVKMEYVQEKDDHTGKTTIRKVGLQPVQRDGVEYEFDVIGDIDMDNSLTIGKTRCSALFGQVFPKPGKDVAKILNEWLPGTGEERVRPAVAQSVVVQNAQAGATQEVKPTPPAAKDAMVPEKLHGIDPKWLTDYWKHHDALAAATNLDELNAARDTIKEAKRHLHQAVYDQLADEYKVLYPKFYKAN